MKALLDQLRVSQAWQEIVVSAPTDGKENSDEQPLPSVIAAQPSSSASVASLLSQLQSSPSWAAVPPGAPTKPTEPYIGHPTAPASVSNESPPPLAVAPVPSPKRPQDPRSYTFQQALPHIAQLADDPGFVAAIKQVILSGLKGSTGCNDLR